MDNEEFYLLDPELRDRVMDAISKVADSYREVHGQTPAVDRLDYLYMRLAGLDKGEVLGETTLQNDGEVTLITREE